MAKEEFILCASVLFEGKIVSAHRHGDCHRLIRSLLGEGADENVGRESQGFLTSKNRHVDRAEGFLIAKANNQIIHTMFDNDETGILTSEDLY